MPQHRSARNPSPQRGSYRPMPLKLPFLIVEMLLLATALAMILVLPQAMPDNDNTAIIDG